MAVDERVKAITTQFAGFDFTKAPVFVAKYVDAFMDSINWTNVARLHRARAVKENLR